MRLEGVHVATVTPFDPFGKVCEESLKKHLTRLADAGVNGFVPCGTTGEAPTLEPSERRRVIDITREVAVSRGLTVVAGCGSNNTSSVLELAREASNAGCNGILVVTPYYNKPTQDGLKAHFTRIADESRLPVYLYNVPGRTGVSLSVDLVAKLFEHENIHGIKEASGQYAQWMGIAAKADIRRKSLLAGDDDAFAAILSLGGCGIISATANVAPELFVNLFSAAREGRWREAYDDQKRLYPLIQAMFTETNPAPAKCALRLMGIMEDEVRLPLVTCTARTQAMIQNALSEVGLTP